MKHFPVCSIAGQFEYFGKKSKIIIFNSFLFLVDSLFTQIHLFPINYLNLKN